MACPGMLTPRYANYHSNIHTYLKEGYSHIITAQCTYPLAVNAVNSQANGQVLTTITYIRTYIRTYVSTVPAHTHTQPAADQHQLPKQLLLKVKHCLCATMTVIRHSLQSETTLAGVLGQMSLVNELIRCFNPILGLGLHQLDRKE